MCARRQRGGRSFNGCPRRFLSREPGSRLATWIPVFVPSESPHRAVRNTLPAGIAWPCACVGRGWSLRDEERLRLGVYAQLFASFGAGVVPADVDPTRSRDGNAHCVLAVAVC